MSRVGGSLGRGRWRGRTNGCDISSGRRWIAFLYTVRDLFYLSLYFCHGSNYIPIRYSHMYIYTHDDHYSPALFPLLFSLSSLCLYPVRVYRGGNPSRALCEEDISTRLYHSWLSCRNPFGKDIPLDWIENYHTFVLWRWSRDEDYTATNCIIAESSHTHLRALQIY